MYLGLLEFLGRHGQLRLEPVGCLHVVLDQLKQTLVLMITLVLVGVVLAVLVCNLRLVRYVYENDDIILPDCGTGDPSGRVKSQTRSFLSC